VDYVGSKVLAFLALLLPLTLSPGPTSIALTAMGMRRGILRSLPFYSGLLLASGAIAGLGGLGLSRLLLDRPVFYTTLRYAGVVYMLYLAAKFASAKPSVPGASEGDYNLNDGLLLTALNPKFYALIVLVFSQFVGPGQGGVWVVVLGIVLVLAISQAVWLLLGAALEPLVKSVRARRIQNRVFAILLAGVAVYMALQEVG
jgi:threonine/homoserine/homoserine lactone efflux protein